MILSFYPNTFYYSSKFLVILVIYDEREPVVSLQSRVTSDERDLASEVITMTVELLTFLVSPQQSFEHLKASPYYPSLGSTTLW